MAKPYNPYPKNSVKWTIMQGSIEVSGGGWADLAPAQIAEVLDMPVLKVRDAILKIEAETGYKIPLLDGRKARLRPIPSMTVTSQLIGLPPGAIRKYERGEVKPSAESLAAIADYFNVNMDYLWGRKKY